MDLSNFRPVSTDIEGAYRRGYHQAIAAVAAVLEDKPGLTAEHFRSWELSEGMKWRKDAALDQQIPPPQL